MPLFVTVTPGTTVSASTTLDAATLNLLGTPSVDVTGTVDGGSVTLGPQSVTLPNLIYQVGQTIVGNGLGVGASPVALTTTDFILTATTVNINTSAVTTAKLDARAVTAPKLFALDGTTTTKLVGRYTTSSGDVETVTVGSNIITNAGTLSVLRPAVVFTDVLTTAVYVLPAARISAIEITQLTTSITPQTATSKVLVQFNISCEAYYVTAFILERVIGAAVQELGIPTSAGSRINGIKVMPYDVDMSSTQSIVPICFVDSPASTASVSYRIKVYSNVASANDNFYLNRSITDIDSTLYTRATSQVILQEILP